MPVKSHPTVPYTLPDGTTANIDEEIVELIDLLNRNGIRTHNCCQGDNRTGYVQFENTSLSRSFVTKLIRHLLGSPFEHLWGIEVCSNPHNQHYGPVACLRWFPSEYEKVLSLAKLALGE